MDTIRYYFASIEGSRMDIAQSAARLNNALDELKSYLAPLVATWEGEAADAYQVQQQRWNRAQEDLNQVLDRIGVVVGQGNDAMNDTNHRAAASWQ